MNLKVIEYLQTANKYKEICYLHYQQGNINENQMQYNIICIGFAIIKLIALNAGQGLWKWIVFYSFWKYKIGIIYLENRVSINF